MFQITGIHHLELTVSNLDRSKQFYLKLPGFKIVAEYPNFVMFYCYTFYLGLTDHQDKNLNNTFSEFNVGMDHISFEVGSLQDLDDAIKFFNENNIVHGEIKKLSNNVYVLAFRDPDNIQLELSFRDSSK